MKRLAMCLWMACTAAALAEQRFFVAADAPAGGDGSRARPFKTCVAARDALRAARREGRVKPGEAVTVELGAGVYPLGASFELAAEDGGAAGAPVVYRAAARGAARLVGGVALAAERFKPVAEPKVLERLDAAARGKVLVCDVGGDLPGVVAPLKTAYQGVPASPWLYAGGKPMTLARWPNGGAWASFKEAVDTGLPHPDAAEPALHTLRPGSFRFGEPRAARWRLEEGVWLLGYWTHDWCDEVIRIAAYDPEKQVVTLAAPHRYGVKGNTWGAAERRFFALNALEELDAPGEWYLDRGRKLLYFYPDGGQGVEEVVLATLAQPLVRVRGAKHVRLEGLALGYGHGDGVVVEGGERVEVVGCVIENLAASGISLNGVSNVVRSCDLRNLGKSGIYVTGGDRKTLRRADNLVENNHIHNYGIFQRTYAPGVGVQGCGQVVRHNRIHDAPHNAVLYGGNEHLFEFNEIFRVVMETGDAGAFYTGRDWTTQGNVLRYNYVHDLGAGDAAHINTMGVYLDDCDCGDTIEGNVFYRAGRAIMIGGGRDNPVLNNLVVECPIALHIDSRGTTWPHWNNPTHSGWNLEEKAEALRYRQPPWSERYPRLAKILDDRPREPLYNPVRGNVVVDCNGRQVCDFDKGVWALMEELEIADNLVVNSDGRAEYKLADEKVKGFINESGSAEKPMDLGFVDRAGGNFALKPDSWLRQGWPAFKPIPFDKIGLYKDEYRP